MKLIPFVMIRQPAKQVLDISAIQAPPIIDHGSCLNPIQHIRQVPGNSASNPLWKMPEHTFTQHVAAAEVPDNSTSNHPLSNMDHA